MGWKVVDGGSKIVDGRVVLVFWGDEWTNGTTDPKPYVSGVQSILAGPYLSALDQYGAVLVVEVESRVRVTHTLDRFRDKSLL